MTRFSTKPGICRIDCVVCGHREESVFLLEAKRNGNCVRTPIETTTERESNRWTNKLCPLMDMIPKVTTGGRRTFLAIETSFADPDVLM